MATSLMCRERGSHLALLWSCSSTAERHLDTVEDVGSNPTGTTTEVGKKIRAPRLREGG